MSKMSKNEQENEPMTKETAQEPSGAPEGCEETEDLARIFEIRAAEAQKRAAELQAENAELKDQYLRKLADYENFRKRMVREKDDAVQFANAALLQDLLGILDDFDRAIQSSEVSRDFQILHDGIGMVRNRMLSILENKYGMARFESEGAQFDPNIHEAVAMEKGAVPEPVVSEEFLKGYKLNGRLLRAAKVKVRMPDGTEKGAETAEEGGDTPREPTEA